MYMLYTIYSLIHPYAPIHSSKVFGQPSLSWLNRWSGLLSVSGWWMQPPRCPPLTLVSSRMSWQLSLARQRRNIRRTRPNDASVNNSTIYHKCIGVSTCNHSISFATRMEEVPGAIWTSICSWIGLQQTCMCFNRSHGCEWNARLLAEIWERCCDIQTPRLIRGIRHRHRQDCIPVL